MTAQQNAALIPEQWREIYRNTLAGPEQTAGFRLEGTVP